MRLTAANAALQAVLNQILACNNKGMSFASDVNAEGRDAEGTRQHAA